MLDFLYYVVCLGYLRRGVAWKLGRGRVVLAGHDHVINLPSNTAHLIWPPKDDHFGSEHVHSTVSC